MLTAIVGVELEPAGLVNKNTSVPSLFIVLLIKLKYECRHALCKQNANLNYFI
jgi:hypothetical protein